MCPAIKKDDKYKLVGTVKIPEDKKVEFNNYVLQLLYLCGIRKTETMEAGGRNFTVVTVPKPDDEGIVQFDYSIFEKRKRSISTYNMLSCELISYDRGYNEFGLTMNMIMILQEAFSETPCYLLYQDEPFRIEGYAALIKSLLDICLEFPHRARMWEMLLFLRNTTRRVLDVKVLLDIFPDAFCDWNIWQLVAALRTEQSELQESKEAWEKGKDIETASEHSIEHGVYKIMNKLIQNGGADQLHAFLKDLLDKDLPDRQQMMNNSEEYALLAEASLYLMLPFMVSSYAFALKKPFWDIWDSLGIVGYTDIKPILYKTKSKSKEGYNYPFYRAIFRKDKDEFIEFWSDKGMGFSDEMEDCFIQWRKQIDEIEWDSNISYEKLICGILEEISEERKCRLPDKSFVTEFVEHQDDEMYGRALLLYKEILDKDTEYFPELTKSQAKQWIIKSACDSFNFTMIDTYHALLINHKHRYEILGF